MPFIAMGIGTVLGDILLPKLGGDEVEHLYASWQVFQGLVPFRDFWQHHTPMLWYATSPLIGNLSGGWTLYLAVRSLAALTNLLAIAVGWRIAQSMDRESAGLLLYLALIFSCAARGEWSVLRPDPPMILFSLLGLYFVLRAEKDRKIWYLAAGIALGLAISISPKWYALIILGPIAILLQILNSKPKTQGSRLKALSGEWNGLLESLGLFAFGAILGLAPLLAYLIHHGIFSDFVTWVLEYNSQRLRFNAGLMAVYPVLALIGFFFIFRRNVGKPRLKFWTMAAGCILVLLSTLTITNTSLRSVWDVEGLRYYSWGFFLLCSIMACFLPVSRLSEWFPRCSLAALSLIFGFIFLPTFSHLNALAFNFRSGQTLERSIAINRWMLEKSAGRPALLWFPYHPTYTRHCLDSSMPLHHFILQDTQPLLSTNFAGMRNIADRIIQCRPGLVDLNETIPRLLVLTQWKILSRQDLQRILIYFRTDYQEVRAFDRIYLLLNNAARRTSINSIATILRTPAE